MTPRAKTRLALLGLVLVLSGFGVDVVDKTVIGYETDPRIVGHDVSNGQEAGGLTAMENLLSKDPGITVVHTINEPTAAGAYTALTNAGVQDKVVLVSVDGGCAGVQAIKDGKIYADPVQYPEKIGQETARVILQYLRGEQPPPQILIPTGLYRKADGEKDTTLK